MNQSLQQIWDELNKQGLGTDKGDIHSYLSIYEDVLAPYRETANNVLEIGIFKGHSLLMWEKYFSGKVYGMDCSETPHGGMADLRPLIAEGTHNIIIGDAVNEFDVYKNFKGVLFQVIIDDGNHLPTCQLKSYEIFSKYLSDDGIYIIEDIENIDETIELFKNIDSTKQVEIIDLRNVKNRFDDVLITIKNKK